MEKKSFWQIRSKSTFVVAPTAAGAWVVAFSRRLIPGALFTSKDEAIRYAYLLAGMIGLGGDDVRILGSA